MFRFACLFAFVNRFDALGHADRNAARERHANLNQN